MEFCYGSLLTRYLHALEIEEEVHDVCPPCAPHLVCHLVDVTKTEVHDPSQGKVLSTVDRQTMDHSKMGQMYGMIELQLWIGGYSEIEDENATLLEHFPLTNSAIYMCWMGSTFEEPIDDDDATSDEEDGSEEDGSNIVGPSDEALMQAMVMVMQPLWLWILV